MAFQRRPPGRFRAVIVDLDEVLLLREPAWRYSVEEAIAAVTGQRVNASSLSAEYRLRPWQHVLSVILPDRADAARAEPLCQEIYERSAMKRLLVQEGVGMVLDRFRGEGVEVAAVSREPHHIARKQVESTGLDRFLTALSGRGDGDGIKEAVRDCLAFMEHEAARCAFVSPAAGDLVAAAALGLICFEAAWERPPAGSFPALRAPGDLLVLLEPGAPATAG